MTKKSTTRRVKRPRRFGIREDKKHRIEVHVAGFCFRFARRRLELLVAKRTTMRELYPGKWECGGGQVHSGEGFEAALRRQYGEEFGLAVSVVGLFSTYEIHPPSGPRIPGVKYLCVPQVDSGEEEVTLNEREFTEYRWVSLREAKKLNLISGVKKEIEAAFVQMRSAFAYQSGRSAAKRKMIGFGKSEKSSKSKRSGGH